MSVSRAQTILAEADLRPHLKRAVGDERARARVRRTGRGGLRPLRRPPANAIVVSVDEKTSIAAREPARPDTPPAPGRPARRDSEYLRNGTQNLFAALEVHSGAVSGMTAATRNQFDFITFLDQLEAEIPAGQRVIAILDNLSTHKTEAVRSWLDAHPRWRFVFTPKHASWLNQVELFFSILARRLLKHGAFTSPHDLAVQMLTFVEHYNLTAKPFAWTYTGKVLAR